MNVFSTGIIFNTFYYCYYQNDPPKYINLLKCISLGKTEARQRSVRHERPDLTNNLLTVFNVTLKTRRIDRENEGKRIMARLVNEQAILRLGMGNTHIRTHTEMHAHTHRKTVSRSPV